MMTSQNHTTSPRVSWDTGTAYDFFVSLWLLHNPEEVGLRNTWAAGVRSRLPADDRIVLEKIVEVVEIPLLWIYNLPSPKDAFTAIYTLKNMNPDSCLMDLVFCEWCGQDDRYKGVIQKITTSGVWDRDDFDKVQSIHKNMHKMTIPGKRLERILTTWSKAKQYGGKFVQIAQTYYNVFFHEEETRIKKSTDAFLINMQEKSKSLSLMELVEEASRGLQIKDFLHLSDIVFVPSYWISPLVFQSELHSENDRIVLFGARPSHESLIPGEVVPENLLLALNSMSDPTRLQILRYLMQEKLTQAELSKKLRLRAPTITHHLHDLRLAGLVGFESEGTVRYYSARITNINETMKMLNEFLEKPSSR